MFSVSYAQRALGALALSIAVGSAWAQALSLRAAQRFAEVDQPRLAAQRAGIAAAQEASVAARQLPDPKLRLGLVNVPVSGADALSLGAEAMTMTMVGLMQEFPRASKRSLQGELQALAGESGQHELEALRRQIRRDAGLAWLDAWAAQRARALVEAQQREARIEVEALAIALRNNRATTADVAQARVALALLDDRARQLDGDTRAARAALTRWIGELADAPLPTDAPTFSVTVASDGLHEHPEVAVAEAQARMAETDARLAGLSTRPDWSLEFAYGRRGSAFGDMVTLQVQIDLPILQTNRQDRSIAAKAAQAQQAHALREDRLRALRADARRLQALVESAQARVDVFEQQVLPESRARLDAALAAYRGGKGGLADVLAARQTLLELELEALARRVEHARAALGLEYLTEGAPS